MPKKKTRGDSRKGPGGHKAKLQPHRKLLSPDEPDVSSILKVPGTGQTEESDDVFDHPLHSTAVSDIEEEGGGGEEEEVGEDLHPEPDSSTSNSSDSELEKKNTRKSKDRHSVKSRVEKKGSEKDPSMENMRAADFTPGAEDCKLPSARSLRRSFSQCTLLDRNTHSVKNFHTDKIPKRSAKSQRKRKEVSPEMEEDDSDDSYLVNGRVPKGKKKGARRVTEYDDILDEFEKVTAKYKEGVELKICRKAIDSFYTGVKDHLINTIAGAEELKNTKLKNMKMVRATNKKRRRLIEVKEELIRTEPLLKKLEREHAELKEKISSLRNAMQLLTDLKDLQQKYVNERKENPQENVVYGISSLPALLVESQRILGAEGHFRNINRKLQQALNLQKEN